MASSIGTGLALIALAGGAAAEGLVIYPAKGQSSAQQSKDESECQAWAKQNTGIDPLALANAASQPAAAASQQATGGERVRGAAKGALVGAGVGAIAGDAGKGAAVGAAGGTAVGGARQRAKQRENAAAQGQAQADANAQKADVQAKLATFNKAYSACLEGRGYSVK
ncbi:MAG TPA: YMGG-like glycine zipper-containing protein [Myxococcota bacterium]|nr:YMGG-like glycine zipper-containing protein [Myxococcota bacterium]